MNEKGKEVREDSYLNTDLSKNPSKNSDLVSFKNFLSIDKAKGKDDREEKENREKREKREKRERIDKCEDEITGYYMYDYNILKIDYMIKKKIRTERKAKSEYYKKILEREKKNVSNRQTLIERKSSRNIIAECEKNLEILYEKKDKSEYLEKSAELINLYKKIKPLNTVLTLTEQNEVLTESDEEQEIRHSIIWDYLEISRKYLKINLIRTFPKTQRCVGCKLIDLELYKDMDGIASCPNCGLETTQVIKSASYADSCRVNNSRNNYEDRNNFEKALKRKQGKQFNKPPKELYIELEKYFISKNMNGSDYYLSLPLLKDGSKQGSNKEMIFEALSKLGYAGYYDDIDVICSIFFGWELIDLSNIEDEIMKDYDEFQDAYEQLPDKEGRKSNLNVQWKMYFLFLHRGIPCKMTQFKLPTTPTILSFHKEITRKVCEILNWTCPFV